MSPTDPSPTRPSQGDRDPTRPVRDEMPQSFRFDKLTVWRLDALARQAGLTKTAYLKAMINGIYQSMQAKGTEKATRDHNGG